MNKDKEKINLKIFINSLLNNIKDNNIKLNIINSIQLKKDYFDILINNNEYKKQALSTIIKNIGLN